MEELDFRIPVSPTSEPPLDTDYEPKGYDNVDKSGEESVTNICPESCKHLVSTCGEYNDVSRTQANGKNYQKRKRSKPPKKNRRWSDYIGSASLLNARPVAAFRNDRQKRPTEGQKPQGAVSDKNAERPSGTVLRFTRRPNGGLKSTLLNDSYSPGSPIDQSLWSGKTRAKPLKKKVKDKVPKRTTDKKARRNVVYPKPQLPCREFMPSSSSDDNPLLSSMRLGKRKISGVPDYPAYADMVLKTQRHLLSALSPYTSKRACMPKEVRDVSRKRSSMAQITAILNYQDQMRHLLLSEYCHLSKLVTQVETACKTGRDSAGPGRHGAPENETLLPSGWQILTTYDVNDPSSFVIDIPRVSCTLDGVLVRDRPDLVQAALLCSFGRPPHQCPSSPKDTHANEQRQKIINSTVTLTQAMLPKVRLDEPFDKNLGEPLHTPSVLAKQDSDFACDMLNLPQSVVYN